jgi:hypothetical protein
MCWQRSPDSPIENHPGIILDFLLSSSAEDNGSSDDSAPEQGSPEPFPNGGGNQGGNGEENEVHMEEQENINLR